MTDQPRNQSIPASSLEYRPRNYFGRFDLQAELLTHVQGFARRVAIKDVLECDEIDTIPEHVKAAELDPDYRLRIGFVHPMFMGGEYLPPMMKGEVEIARISIKSTTYDVAVMYARLVGRRIYYRVLDEYDGETMREPTTRTSVRPLTMGQMVDFITHAWDFMGCLELNYGKDVEGMLDFFEGESEFYPCFDSELRNRVEAWYPAYAPDPEEYDESDDPCVKED